MSEKGQNRTWDVVGVDVCSALNIGRPGAMNQAILSAIGVSQVWKA
jgi:hypothetical protein